MNIFSKKSFLKKIAITILTVLLLQTIVVKPVHADAAHSVLEGGGKLLKPVFSLLTTVGDSIVSVLHYSILRIDNTLIQVKIRDNVWDSIGRFLLRGASLPFAILEDLQGIISLLQGDPGKSLMVKDANNIVATFFDKEALPATLYLPIYQYSPEEIFKGNILLYNVNFFREPIKVKGRTLDGTSFEVSDFENKKGEVDEKALEQFITDHQGLDGYYYIKNEGKDNQEEVITSRQDSAGMLQKTISNWYNALRNICLVLMLSVLVYIGIRMLLTSVASDKAKYLTMLKDWFIGICLLFLMHYIMAFSVTIVEKITDVVSTSADKNYYVVSLPKEPALTSAFKDMGIEDQVTVNDNAYGWKTNLMGYLRLSAQMDTTSKGWTYIGESIMFIMLVVFTGIFTFQYLKRLLYMAFLTLISPLVALTYCIDKINDGQAQGFNRWLKEYIFNLLLQPMHLLLYYILVTSSFSMIGTNVIYSIVAIAFLLPAEKILRSFFGFEKAHTPPTLGPAGAMMAASGLTALINKGKAATTASKGGNGSGGQTANSNNKINYTENGELLESFTNGYNDEEQPDNLDTSGEGEHPLLNDGDSQTNDNEQNDGRMPNGEQDPTLPSESENNNDNNARTIEIENEEDRIPEDRTHRDDSNSEQRDRSPVRLFNRGAKGIKAGARRATRTAEALGAYGVGKAKRTISNLPRTIVRTGIKAVPGVATGALAAGAGIALGASTGDFGNVLKLGGAGAIGGYSIGSNIPAKIVNDIKNDPEFQTRYNKGDYKNDAINDDVKKFKKSQEYEKIRAELEAAYGRKEAKEMLKSENGGHSEVDKYLRNGITDVKAIKAMHDMQNNVSTINNTEQAIDSYKLLQNIGDIGSAKKQDEGKATIKRMAKGKIRDNRIDQFADDRMNEMLYLRTKMK